MKQMLRFYGVNFQIENEKWYNYLCTSNWSIKSDNSAKQA